jgi:hypothetical protein
MVALCGCSTDTLQIGNLLAISSYLVSCELYYGVIGARLFGHCISYPCWRIQLILQFVI